jgi:hypothetical protein
MKAKKGPQPLTDARVNRRLRTSRLPAILAHAGEVRNATIRAIGLRARLPNVLLAVL